MIVYSTKQFLVLIPNTMTLEKDGNFFYVEKSLYDSLVVLRNNYETSRVGELIAKENNLEVIEWLIDKLPQPLDAIAPFLRIVSKEVEQDLEVCIGSLHEIFCTGLNPYGFLRTPLEMRRDIEFGRTGSLYKEMWKGIMTQYVDFDEVINMLSNSHSIVGSNTSNFNVAYKDNVKQEEVRNPLDNIQGFVEVDGVLYMEDEEDDEVLPLDFSKFLPKDDEVITYSTYSEKEEVKVEKSESELSEFNALELALLGGN